MDRARSLSEWGGGDGALRRAIPLWLARGLSLSHTHTLSSALALSLSLSPSRARALSRSLSSARSFSLSRARALSLTHTINGPICETREQVDHFPRRHAPDGYVRNCSQYLMKRMNRERERETRCVETGPRNPFVVYGGISLKWRVGAYVLP
jgi:hypothetical protein